MDSQIVRTASEVPTILAAIQSEDQADKKQKLIGAGVEIIETESVDGHVDLQELMKQLGARNIDGILLEGGGTLNESALKSRHCKRGRCLYSTEEDFWRKCRLYAGRWCGE